MKPSPFARLFAVLGFATLIGLLLFSRDNQLKHQGQAPAAQAVTEMPANANKLSPTIETLSEAPKAAEPAPAAEPAGTPSPKAEAAKAKG